MRKYWNRIKLHLPCYIVHWWVGCNGSEYEFCIKCLWERNRPQCKCEEERFNKWEA